MSMWLKLIGIAFVLQVSCWAGTQDDIPAGISPDGRLEVTISFSAIHQLQISASYDSKPLLAQSPLGIALDISQYDFTRNLSYHSRQFRVIDETYQMPTGKRRIRRNHCHEYRYHLTNKKGRPLVLILRLYNDGIAIRYQLDNSDAAQVTHEQTGWQPVSIKKLWSIPFSSGDEQLFTGSASPANLPVSPRSWPVLVETDSSRWLLFSEADVSNYPLSSGQFIDHTLHYVFARPSEGRNHITKRFLSPWRVAIVGCQLGNIVQSTLIDHLAPPASGDFSWVEAGVAAFPWWGDNLANSHPESLKKYIDLAAAMHWRYIEFDVALIGSPGHAVEQWKTTPWITDVINYGRSRGVLCYGWDEFKNLDTPAKRAAIFGRYRDLGIVGCKVDFINSYAQLKRRQVEEIIQDAARYHLMLSFHGAQSPRGFARTYPHVMTFEAVRGAEYYLPINKSRGLTPEHICTLPFTRNVLGSMDFTPVAFTSSLRQTTMAHELALAVVFESGWQGMCDIPAAYLNSPARPFLTGLPAAWDETRFLDGYPGEYCCLARRKDKTWYIAGISAKDSCNITLDLASIIQSDCKTTLYLDKPGTQDTLITQEKILHPDQPLTLVLKTNGGFAFIIE